MLTKTRTITYADALCEAIDQSMAADERVFTIGLGVPDPKAVFGTTSGLLQKYGRERVLDMPCAENAITGILVGAAVAGRRPVLTHQRLDFALLSVDQIVNNAAKWHYMFGGQMEVPLVIRMIIGRGWGQGPQHAQNLQSWFAHIPGLKVIAPSTPADAKSMMMEAIADPGPVITIEHRWLYNQKGEVPVEPTRSPLGKAVVRRAGDAVTLVSSSYWVLEALRAAAFLAEQGIEAEVVDLRTLAPLDSAAVAASVERTGRLIAIDGGWSCCGIAGELIAAVAERGIAFKAPPKRITFPSCPTPTSWPVAKAFYPTAVDIAEGAAAMVGQKLLGVEELEASAASTGDIPDPYFTGPF